MGFRLIEGLTPKGQAPSQLFLLLLPAPSDSHPLPDYMPLLQQLHQYFPMAALVVSTTDTPSASIAQPFIHALQSSLNIPPEATAIIGLANLGSVCIELAWQKPALAGRLIAIRPSTVPLPIHAPSLDSTLHLLVGQDQTLSPNLHQQLLQAGADATVDTLSIDPDKALSSAVQQGILQRLTTCVPLRYCQEAQQA